MSRGSRRHDDPFRIASEALAGRPTRWQNLGLWRGTRDYETACETLAMAVGNAGAVKPGDRVVELACGAGAAVPLWRNHFGAAEVVGVEVDSGRAALAAELGRVFAGKALVGGRLGVPDGTEPVDAVLCVDAAYHIGPAKVLATACHAALRDGGRLAFTTLTCKENTGSSRVSQWLARRAGIAEGAIESRGRWVQILSDAGFGDIRVVPLDEVFAGFAAHVARRRVHGWRSPGWAKVEATAWLAQAGLWTRLFGYTLVSARRRASNDGFPGNSVWSGAEQGLEQVGPAGERAPNHRKNR